MNRYASSLVTPLVTSHAIGMEINLQKRNAPVAPLARVETRNFFPSIDADSRYTCTTSPGATTNRSVTRPELSVLPFAETTRPLRTPKAVTLTCRMGEGVREGPYVSVRRRLARLAA